MSRLVLIVLVLCVNGWLLGSEMFGMLALHYQDLHPESGLSVAQTAQASGFRCSESQALAASESALSTASPDAPVWFDLALTQQPANPYRWSRASVGYYLSGQQAAAQIAALQALRMAPNTVSISREQVKLASMLHSETTQHALMRAWFLAAHTATSEDWPSVRKSLAQAGLARQYCHFVTPDLVLFRRCESAKNRCMVDPTACSGDQSN